MQRPTSGLLREASANEVQHWNELVTQNPDGGSILQTIDFAHIKQSHHWRPRYLIFTIGAQQIAVVVLEQSIFALGSLWYVPKGPGCLAPEDVRDFLTAAHDYIQQHALNVFCVKVEPEIPTTSNSSALMRAGGLIQSDPVQANTSSIVLRIHHDPEEQMASLGRRARRYIRRAQREDVVIKRVSPTPGNFRTMHALMSTAYGGRGIPGLRPYDYYAAFWSAYSTARSGRLYFGFEDDVVVTGVFVVLLGKKAVYKDGGSVQRDSDKGASYAIHWHIMNELSEEGIELYDLWGSPPSRQLNNPQHPLWGLGQFKTAFSKEIVDYMGTWDCVIRPLQYTLWRVAGYKIMRMISRIKHTSFW